MPEDKKKNEISGVDVELEKRLNNEISQCLSSAGITPAYSRLAAKKNNQEVSLLLNFLPILPESVINLSDSRQEDLARVLIMHGALMNSYLLSVFEKEASSKGSVMKTAVRKIASTFGFGQAATQEPSSNVTNVFQRIFGTTHLHYEQGQEAYMANLISEIQKGEIAGLHAHTAANTLLAIAVTMMKYPSTRTLEHATQYDCMDNSTVSSEEDDDEEEEDEEEAPTTNQPPADASDSTSSPPTVDPSFVCPRALQEDAILLLACSFGWEDLFPFVEEMRNGELTFVSIKTTPLMEASAAGLFKTVKTLIEKGADVNAKSVPSQNSPLIYASMGGNLNCVYELIRSRRVMIMNTNKFHHDALMEAASAGHLHIVKALVEVGGARSRLFLHTVEYKESALTFAAFKGHYDIVKYLIESEYIVSEDEAVQEEELFTALMEASMDGHIEMARLLFNSGAPLKCDMDTRESPLSLACNGNHVDLVRYFLESGASTEDYVDEGITPLMEAAREDRLAIVQLLLSYGADVNAESDESGETPMTMAATKGNLQVMECLYNSGASLTAGTTPPIAEAAAEGHMEVVKWIFAKCPNLGLEQINHAFAMAAGCGRIELMKFFLEKGAQVNAEIDGRTPLMRAAVNDYIEAVRLLIENGAEVNQKSSRADATSLSLAVGSANNEVVKYLLDNGGDPFMEHKEGATCIYECAKNGNVDLMQILIERSKMEKPANMKIPPLSLPTRHIPPKPIPAPTTTNSSTTQTTTCNLPCGHGTITKSTSTRSVFKKTTTTRKVSTTTKVVEGVRNGSEFSSIEKQFKFSGKMKRECPEYREAEVMLHEMLKSSKFKNGEFPFGFPEADRMFVQMCKSFESRDPACAQAANELMTMMEAYQKAVEEAQAETAALKYDLRLSAEKRKEMEKLMHKPAKKAIRQAHNRMINNSECRFEENLKLLLNPKVVPEGFCEHYDHALKDPPICSNCLKKNTLADITEKTAAKSRNTMLDKPTEVAQETPLSIACANGHKEVVELLLSENAYIEHRDKRGFTPLIIAASVGHTDVLEALLMHRANTEAHTDRTKDTALSLACSAGKTDCVKLLLEYGAAKEHRNVSDYTPLSLAASGGHTDVIRLLLDDGAEINSRTGSKLGISPLMLAAMNGHAAATKLLLDRGSDINAQIETNRNTALTLAAFQGRTEVVRLLLDYGACVEHRAKTGLTPLMEAANGGYDDVGRLLLNANAEPNTGPVPTSRDTALTIAADKGHEKFVTLLLDHGAAVDTKNKKGCTALWLASNGGHEGVVKVLCQAGADPDVVDNRKVTPLMAAFKKGHNGVLFYLLERAKLFPSDQELERAMDSIDNADILFKCKTNIKLINEAKEFQRVAAEKNAEQLLAQLIEEEETAQAKKQAKQQKKGKKKAKKAKDEVASIASTVSLNKDQEGMDDDDGQQTIEEDVEQENTLKEAAPAPSTKDNGKRQSRKEITVVVPPKIRTPTPSPPPPPAAPKNMVIRLPPVTTIVDQPLSPKQNGEEWVKANGGKKKAKKAAAATITTSTNGAQVGRSTSMSQRESSLTSETRSVMKSDARGRKESQLVVESATIARIIGRGGSNINAIREATGATIEVEKQGTKKDPSANRQITIRGPAESVRNATMMVNYLAFDSEIAISDVVRQVLNQENLHTSSTTSESSVRHAREDSVSSSVSVPKKPSPPPDRPSPVSFAAPGTSQPPRVQQQSQPAQAPTAPTNVWQQRIAAREQLLKAAEPVQQPQPPVEDEEEPNNMLNELLEMSQTEKKLLSAPTPIGPPKKITPAVQQVPPYSEQLRSAHAESLNQKLTTSQPEISLAVGTKPYIEEPKVDATPFGMPPSMVQKLNGPTGPTVPQRAPAKSPQPLTISGTDSSHPPIQPVPAFESLFSDSQISDLWTNQTTAKTEKPSLWGNMFQLDSTQHTDSDWTRPVDILESLLNHEKLAQQPPTPPQPQPIRPPTSAQSSIFPRANKPVQAPTPQDANNHINQLAAQLLSHREAANQQSKNLLYQTPTPHQSSLLDDIQKFAPTTDSFDSASVFNAYHTNSFVTDYMARAAKLQQQAPLVYGQPQAPPTSSSSNYSSGPPPGFQALPPGLPKPRMTLHQQYQRESMQQRAEAEAAASYQAGYQQPSFNLWSFDADAKKAADQANWWAN